MNRFKKHKNYHQEQIEKTDQHCINEISRGIPSGLESLYLKYREEFIGWAKSQCKLQESDAFDFYQTAILIIQENIIKGKLLRLKENSIKAYLYKTAKNLILENSRKQSKSIYFSDINTLNKDADYVLGSLNIDEPSKNNTDALLEKELLEGNLIKLEQALVEIGDPCRTLLTKFYYENSSIKSIVETTHFSNVNSVKSKLYECRERIRKMASIINIKSNFVK